MPSSVKPSGGAGERVLLVPAEELAPVLGFGVPQEQIEAAVRGGCHGGADLELRVRDPADDVAGVLWRRVQVAGGEGEAVDVVEFGVLPVKRDEQRVGEVAALVHDLGLHVVKRGQVAVLLGGRVHGVHAPVLVAALVLEVDDVPVVLRPEADPDAAFAVVGHGLEVLERGPDRPDPDVENALLAGRGRRGVPRRGRGAVLFARGCRTGPRVGSGARSLFPPCGRHSISARRFGLVSISACWLRSLALLAVCTEDCGHR